jgi:hypothetical protein
MEHVPYRTDGTFSLGIWCASTHNVDPSCIQCASYWLEPEGLRAWTRLLWRYLATEHPGELHHHIAAAALRICKVLQETPAREEIERKAVRDLANLLCDTCRAWRPHLPLSDADPLTQDGLLALDAVFFRLLGQPQHNESRRLFEELRTTAPERGWNGWLEAKPVNERKSVLNCKNIKVLAAILWHEHLAESFHRTLRHRPAITVAVYDGALIPSMSRQLTLPIDGEDLIVRDTRGLTLGRLDVPATDAELIRTVFEGLDLLGSVAGQRILKHFVLTVHERTETEKQGARVLDFTGGWSTFADAVGADARERRRLEAILEAGQRVIWDNGTLKLGGLWTWTYTRGSRQGPGLVRVVVGDPLAPGLAPALEGRTPSRRSDKLLVPELRYEPPVRAVRPNEQGSALTLHRLLLLELVKRSPELATHGAITLNMPRWHELAAKAGLPGVSLPRLLDSWVEGDDKAPALIKRDGPHVTLADEHEPERAFIVAGGNRRVRGKKKGKASAAKRQKRDSS